MSRRKRPAQRREPARRERLVARAIAEAVHTGAITDRDTLRAWIGRVDLKAMRQRQ